MKAWQYLILSAISLVSTVTSGFIVDQSLPVADRRLTTMSSGPSTGMNDANHAGAEHPFCSLPGDPSLILTTNVDLGDKKMDIMKSISKAMSAHTGKPESYIGTYSLFEVKHAREAVSLHHPMPQTCIVHIAARCCCDFRTCHTSSSLACMLNVM